MALMGGSMDQLTDLSVLAREIAEIAARTTEPEIAVRLMELVNRLLSEAGLPEERCEAPAQRRH
jgi:hypothetical protein